MKKRRTTARKPIEIDRLDSHSRCSLVRGDPRSFSLFRGKYKSMIQSARNFRLCRIFVSPFVQTVRNVNSTNFIELKGGTREITRRITVQFQFRPRNHSPTNLHESWKIQQRVQDLETECKYPVPRKSYINRDPRMLSSLGERGKRVKVIESGKVNSIPFEGRGKTWRRTIWFSS